MATHEIRAADLARTIEVSTASLSRILNGQAAPSHETLKLLIRLVAKDDAEAREIIRAHLLDELERLDSSDLAAVVVGDGANDTGYEHLVSSLMQAARSFEEVAGLARQIADLSEKQSMRSRTGTRPEASGAIAYPEAKHATMQVAESPMSPKSKQKKK